MLVIRNATAVDAPLITGMIREFAEFEHELELVEWDGQTAAYALYFFTYSTVAARPGLFVEDLFVRAQFRRKGIGKALLQHMAVIAREQNCYGMRWEVLNWNTSAIDFYRSLGAKIQSEWFPVLFKGTCLEEFAMRERRP